jgi:phage regulator Rha-like protein
MELVAKCDRFSRLKHSTVFPLVFTEHGAIMAANVLNSQRAIEASVYVVRAFVKMREVLATHKEFARRLDEMEQKYDARFKVVFDAIRALMEPPANPRRRIGY